MKRGSWWPIGMGAILAAGVAANVWLMRVANSDPSFAVEERYYERAVHYDDVMAQRRENQALGWRLTPRLSAIGADSSGGVDLDVSLADSAGLPLDGARIMLVAVHNARAAEPLTATLAATVPGHYAVWLPIRRPGLWEIQFEVRRGNDRFTAADRFDATSANR